VSKKICRGGFAMLSVWKKEGPSKLGPAFKKK
jgi:hypothetical protein